MFTGGTFSANDGYIYSASINQNYNANKTILKANCTDSSGNTDVVYTLIYADEQFFTINSSSGIVSLAVDGWEFPHDGIYIALINCQLERRLPPVTATLHVTFKTQNYFTPVFRHPNLFEFTFPEDYNISQNRELVTLNATDGDKGDCGRIIYSIATGNSRNTFEITQSSGVVSFARSLDWEITSEYNLQVTAGPVDMTRCSYPSLPSAVATIRVFVNDTNDTPPEFDSDLYTVSIQENTKPQEFLQVHCSDPDSSSYIIYLIENIHLFHFNINGINGNLSITNPLDYEQQDSYLLNVACRDTQVLSFDQVDYTLVNITVLPMNEYRPDIVNQGVKNAVIYDDTPVGTLLFSPWPRQDINPPLWLRVEDRDQGLDHSKLTFVLTSIDELARNRIILNQTSGEIILVEEFEKSCYQNFSGQNFRIVNFHLTVCDIANLSSCPTFSLTLYVVQSKCVTMFPQNYTRLYINESAPVGTVIKSIQCIGHEANSNKTLSILHSQDPEIGRTFALSTDGSYIFLKKSLDYEERKHYNIFLLCVNAYGSKAIAELEVVVLPENDNPPYFDKPLYIFNITSLSFSLPIVAGKIQARDMDSDFGVNLTYFLNSSSKYFSVDINGTLLIYAMPPKFRKQYIFEVRASDGKFTAETVVLILLPNDFTDQTCTVTVASDVNTSSVMGLTAIVVFMGVLISLMLVLITFLCVKIKRRPKPEPKTTQIRYVVNIVVI